MGGEFPHIHGSEDWKIYIYKLTHKIKLSYISIYNIS